MLLTFCPRASPVLSQQQPPRDGQTAPRKPRAPPRFTEYRTTTRRWQAAESSDSRLTDVARALEQWRRRTGQHGDYLPSDSHLRRCDVARDLRLQGLIVRAGGHRAVQTRLGLRPRESSAQVLKERELGELAASLAEVCAEAGLPPPESVFPEKRLIRKLSPQLGNRIAAFPGRNGYHRLAEYVKAKAMRLPMSQPGREVLALTGKWRVWTDPQAIRAELLGYQLHPQVLPRLNSLPAELASAIQRQGGATVFAQKHGMVLDKDWVNITRLARIVRWLADEVAMRDGPQGQAIESAQYLDFVREQAMNPPPFPTPERVSSAGFTSELQRYGGRKALAIRLGFARVCGIRDVFMGPFSVQFAADILDHASRQVYVCEDSVAMPTLERLRANDRPDLAEATALFGGEETVGRRVGLVPQKPSEEMSV